MLKKFSLISPILISIYSYYIFATQHIGLDMYKFFPIERLTIDIINGEGTYAFSNRLLAPYIIIFISKIGFDLYDSYDLFIKLFFFFNSLIFFYFLRSCKLNLLNSSLFLILYNFLICSWYGYYYYPWDFIDTVLFLLLAIWIIKDKSYAYFIFLFIITLLNGERAIFFSILMFFNSFDFKSKKINFKSVLIGLILFMATLLYVDFIREYITKSNNNLNFFGNSFVLNQNIKNFIFTNWFNHNFFYSISLIFINIYFFSNFFKFNKKQINLFLIFLTQIISVFIFGVIEETRVFQFIIPVGLLLFISIHEKKIN